MTRAKLSAMLFLIGSASLQSCGSSSTTITLSDINTGGQGGSSIEATITIIPSACAIGIADSGDGDLTDLAVAAFDGDGNLIEGQSSVGPPPQTFGNYGGDAEKIIVSGINKDAGAAWIASFEAPPKP